MEPTGKRCRTKLHWLFLLVTLFFLSLWIMTNASAQTTRPCAEDIAKLCKDVKPGGGDLARCLKEHEIELSPACKAFVVEAEKRTQEMKACRDDANKFCKDIKPGGGRIMKCLREHESELSPACKDRISQAQKK